LKYDAKLYIQHNKFVNTIIVSFSLGFTIKLLWRNNTKDNTCYQTEIANELQ